MASELYADGACGKAGDGGWAWALVRDGQIATWDSGPVLGTTNQRMELHAALCGLLYMGWQHPTEPIQLVSDSAYLTNCLIDKWYEKWVKLGWRTTSDGEIKNSDLWLDILIALEERVAPITYKHVRGHQGDKWNEFVDTLAVDARLNGG